jgi:hypothetical protein
MTRSRCHHRPGPSAGGCGLPAGGRWPGSPQEPRGRGPPGSAPWLWCESDTARKQFGSPLRLWPTAAEAPEPRPRWKLGWNAPTRIQILPRDPRPARNGSNLSYLRGLSAHRALRSSSNGRLGGVPRSSRQLAPELSYRAPCKMQSRRSPSAPAAHAAARAQT